MQFSCKVCEECEERTERRVKEGFCEIAYDSFIDWADYPDRLPPIADFRQDTLKRSNICPVKGEQRLLYVRFPFSFEIGEQFNVLFSPALSYYNGWEEHPEEIDGSAIVRCRFDRILEQNAHAAWIMAEILDVTPFPELYRKYPVQDTDKCIDEPFKGFSSDCFRHRNWEYHFWSAQGDVGGWKMLYTDDRGMKHLVLHCAWDFHQCTIQCGNLVYKAFEKNEWRTKL